MKRFIISSLFMTFALVLVSGISPYLKVAEHEGSMTGAVGKVKTILEEKGYDILGQYQPADNQDLYVLVFTSEDLIAFCRKSKDRGMLAAAMKVGFQKSGGKIVVSIVNPEYLFYAYFREQMEKDPFKSKALQLAEGVKNTFQGTGFMSQPFGGDLSADKLMKYRYMAGMPGFDKEVSLAKFNSYAEGLAAIRSGLSKQANTLQIYEISSADSKMAVFGIGLKNKEEGEAHFLPIIGESHVAAMPYELILQGNEVTMLHGRYRFALHWPELTMKTFTKIMSSPGDVEDAMKGLFETD